MLASLAHITSAREAMRAQIKPTERARVGAPGPPKRLPCRLALQQSSRAVASAGIGESLVSATGGCGRMMVFRVCTPCATHGALGCGVRLQAEADSRDRGCVPLIQRVSRFQLVVWCAALWLSAFRCGGEMGNDGVRALHSVFALRRGPNTPSGARSAYAGVLAGAA